MTDSEMLELAAKAAGIDGWWVGADYCFGYNGNKNVPVPWRPLTDDGEALRLAVECGINPIQCPDSVDAMHFDSCIVETEMFEDHDGDKLAATRRAITSAAAAIQLSKEGI